MKTFRQLREKWIKSGKSGWADRFTIDILINPTRYEMRNFDDPPRGFVHPNGKVYICSDGAIHTDIIRIMGNELPARSSIPFIVEDEWANPVKIRIGDYISRTKWKKSGEVVSIIENNTWFKKMFKKVEVLPAYLSGGFS